MNDKKRTENKNTKVAIVSRRDLALGRRDLMKLGAGAAFAGMLKLPSAFAQQALPTMSSSVAPAQSQQATDTVYVCPMDPDIRSDKPGVCPRCGMTLVSGIPDYSAEYRLDLKLTPSAPKPGEGTKLDFAIFDPYKHNPVKSFQLVHEKLFHMFVVSQDLQFFLHDHPVLNPDGTFTFNNLAFPEPGMYRVLGDFYPTGGTPQLIPKTIFVPGTAPAATQPPVIQRDYSPKDTENMHVEMTSDPGQPIAGSKTILYYHVGPTDGFEQYIGAWAHMLAVSDDLVDLIHTHPTIADGGPNLQFDLIFPRARTYRIWTQFQRKGVVNTSRFDIPVHSIDSLAS